VLDLLTPLAILLAIAGGVWGFVADRIAARWPAHEDGSVRAIDWRTPVVIVVGALSLGALTMVFTEPVATLVFGAYLVVLVLLLAIDLDQRLLPDVFTLPAIPLAFLFGFSGLNPLLPSGLITATVIAILVSAVLFAISIPFGKGAIGQGDLKLLISVGIIAGPLRLVYGVIYGALLAGIVLVVLLVLRRITLKTFVPYGPFLIIGAIYSILVIR
jgi:leader peptidase (prepilin peptidase) / N-methyltransferase